MSELALICALSQNDVIGVNNQLPWHLPADLQFFKRTTLGTPVIMGRNTYESIGRPLPGRANLVISRTPGYSAPGVSVFSALEAALANARQQADQAQVERYFVIGGEQIYRLALPMAQQLYLTRVHTTLEGDAFFPAWQPEHWELLAQEHHPADNAHRFAMDFLHYRRKTAPQAF
jgi:dihydrofolate reductase